jgi:hypothetical protein
MQKKPLLPILLFSLLVLLSFFVQHAHAQTNQCPRIYREGSLLRTDSAQSYQWYKNGEIIPNATQQTYTPTGKSARYSVEVQGKISSALDMGQFELIGQAFDEHLRPVPNASISIGKRTTTTNAQGSFQFANLNNDSTILLRGEKAGHWTSQRRITPTGRQTHVQLMLRSQPFEHELSAERGGTISRGAFFLTLQPNGVLDANNQRYTGPVKIALNGGRPDDPNFGWMMPGGDFMAQDAQGRERILYSYGFLSAHLQTPNGQPLKLDPNNGAHLRFVMPHTMVATAPDSLPLWHFDEAAGIWKEEGLARREGAAYVGTVRHFSSWNCDLPSELATVYGKAFDCKGQPIMRAPMRLGQLIVMTDSLGSYSSVVPSGMPFSIGTINQEERYALRVGPFAPLSLQFLPELRSNGSSLYGYGKVDLKGNLIISAYGNNKYKEYSINNGGVYQSGNIFKIDIDKKYEILVRDSTNCPARIPYIQSGLNDACQILDSLGLSEVKWFYGTNIESALATESVIYKLSMGNMTPNSFFLNMPYYFPCLQELRANNLKADRLPESIGDLKLLQNINLFFSELISLPESFGNLTNLKTVNLERNQLNSLPESFPNLIELQNLYLIQNKLVSLPTTFGRLVKLESLQLSSNQLRQLPESFIYLIQLEELLLNDNDLEFLPSRIGNLSKLKFLELNQNSLKSLPGTIVNLTQLRRLLLSNNQLSNLPSNFGAMSQLQILDLSGNQLTTIPSSMGNLTKLTYLDLTGNPIPSIEIERLRRLLPNCTIYF